MRQRLHNTELHAPAHFDAEILSALGRLTRAETITADDAQAGLHRLARLPVQRHALGGLIPRAWTRRADTRLLDGLYVELADQLGIPLLTVDRRLARVCSLAEDLSAGPDQG